jgi:hypothetical protein
MQRAKQQNNHVYLRISSNSSSSISIGASCIQASPCSRAARPVPQFISCLHSARGARYLRVRTLPGQSVGRTSPQLAQVPCSYGGMLNEQVEQNSIQFVASPPPSSSPSRPFLPLLLLQAVSGELQQTSAVVFFCFHSTTTNLIPRVLWGTTFTQSLTQSLILSLSLSLSLAFVRVSFNSI